MAALLPSAAGFNGQPIRRTLKVSETVAQQIVRDITAGGFKADATLPSEAEMLRMYRVGRASLREALRILEIHGLIVLRPGPGGGPVVAGVSSLHLGRMTALYFHIVGATYGDLLATLQAEWPMMVRAAAENRAPEAVAKLDEHIRTAPDIAGDDSGFLERYSGFFSTIAGMIGNPILEMAGCALKDLFLDRLSTFTVSPEERTKMLGDHLAIAKAVRTGNGARAEKLMRQHMDYFGEWVGQKDPSALSEVIAWQW
jgi:DNA-binding FadR family transcriptional regulator